ncbi:MAG TPA: 4Fe-4S dicluster domain-containing protein [Dehalococcoidales bacterium]|nr:4Fe-4S dicluster domain-containing protein [Dehalococcoidales bacterium]
MANVKEKLSLDTYKIGKETHLIVDQELCKKCSNKCCLWICPAGVYTQKETGEILVDFEACLECGTCLIACENGAIKWAYPKGGTGVQFKYG